MFRSIDDFLKSWKNESESTLKELNGLTDATLSQPVTDDHRTLGRIAWHLTGTPHEMMARTGLHVEGPAEDAPVPATAKAIVDAYTRTSASLEAAIRRQWSDASLTEMDEMYGEQWARGATLLVLIVHQAHHRGQMTVLMRQAGVTVAGSVGPAKEAWAQWGMQPPAV